MDLRCLFPVWCHVLAIARHCRCRQKIDRSSRRFGGRRLIGKERGGARSNRYVLRPEPPPAGVRIGITERSSYRGGADRNVRNSLASRSGILNAGSNPNSRPAFTLDTAPSSSTML